MLVDDCKTYQTVEGKGTVEGDWLQSLRWEVKQRKGKLPCIA